ncbi:MAG: hypothetical protein FRX49_01302 [Trebouxia sp. A1-2]|nr:MAG: hypothetical protein FRX49_01302 [Trebouxia sp. A1-2]
MMVSSIARAATQAASQKHGCRRQLHTSEYLSNHDWCGSPVAWTHVNTGGTEKGVPVSNDSPPPVGRIGREEVVGLPRNHLLQLRSAQQASFVLASPI